MFSTLGFAAAQQVQEEKRQRSALIANHALLTNYDTCGARNDTLRPFCKPKPKIDRTSPAVKRMR